MKVILSLIAACVHMLALAQDWKVLCGIGMGPGWYSASAAQVERGDLGYSFNVFVRSEVVHQILYASVGAQYSVLHGQFITPAEQSAIPETDRFYRHELTAPAIGVPLILGVRTSSSDTRGLRIYGGVSFDYLLEGRREVDFVESHAWPDTEQAVDLVEDRVSLEAELMNSIGMKGMFGMEKMFIVSSVMFTAGLEWSGDLGHLTYTTYADPDHSTFEIARRAISVTLAATLRS